MRIKVIYRKNLKLTEGKLAAQVAHAVKNLKETPRDCIIVVLSASDKKFYGYLDRTVFTKHGNAYLQIDKGLTEIEAGTETALAWIENI